MKAPVTYVIATVVATLVGGGIATAALVYSGAYNVAADDPHMRLTHFVLDTLRMRSIAARADQIQVPDLSNPERIRRGAGNYDAMCVTCHLAPGVSPTELHKGLYPQPPDLSKVSDINAARAFWVVKHGLKASGMPAWGKSMGDEYIWDMVAFLSKLPTLTPAQYAAEVGASDGHSHGGVETAAEGHGHAHGTSAETPNTGATTSATTMKVEPHVHDEQPIPAKPAASRQSAKPAAKDHQHGKGSKPHSH